MLDWFADQAPADVVVEEQNLAMVAVQGPQAIGNFQDATRIDSIDELLPFGFVEHDTWLIARTGYTGEDGVEVILPKPAFS